MSTYNLTTTLLIDENFDPKQVELEQFACTTATIRGSYLNKLDSDFGNYNAYGVYWNTGQKYSGNGQIKVMCVQDGTPMEMSITYTNGDPNIIKILRPVRYPYGFYWNVATFQPRELQLQVSEIISVYIPRGTMNEISPEWGINYAYGNLIRSAEYVWDFDLSAIQSGVKKTITMQHDNTNFYNINIV